MAKKPVKSAKVEEEVSEPVVTDIPSNTPEPSNLKQPKEFPEVGGNGRFQAVEFGGGWVVYNPSGQRASGVVAKQEADNIVLRSNNGIGIRA